MSAHWLAPLPARRRGASQAARLSLVTVRARFKCAESPFNRATELDVTAGPRLDGERGQ